MEIKKKQPRIARITVLYRKNAYPQIRFRGEFYNRTAYAIEEGRGNENTCVIVVLPVAEKSPGRFYSPMWLYVKN